MIKWVPKPKNCPNCRSKCIGSGIYVHNNEEFWFCNKCGWITPKLNKDEKAEA